MRVLCLVLLAGLSLRIAGAEPPAPAPGPGVQAALQEAERERRAADTEGEAAHLAAALAATERAEAAATAAGDLPGIAAAQAARARVLTLQGRIEAAARAWQAAAESRARLGDGPGRILALGQRAALRAAAHPDEAAAQAKAIVLLAAAERNRPRAAAEALNAAGGAFYSQESYETAETLFREVVALRERLAPGTIDQARALDNVGLVRRVRGDLAGAEAFHRRAMAIRQRALPDSEEVALGLNNLGLVAYDRSDLEAAERFHRQALAIWRRRAPDSQECAASLNNLGNVLTERGRFPEAEQCYRRALAIKKRLQPDSVAVAVGLGNLGLFRADRGDLAGAETLHRQALAILERRRPGSSEAAAALHNLGNVAENRSDLEAAEDYYRRAAALWEERGLPQRAVAWSNLGNVLIARGDLSAGEAYHRKALSLRTRLAPGSLAVAQSLGSLGYVAWARRDLSRAKAYNEQALAIFQKEAPGSLEMATAFGNLGNVAYLRGDLTRADRLYRRSLALRERLAPDSLEIADSLNSLSAVALRQGRIAPAEQRARRAWAIARRQAQAVTGDEARLAYAESSVSLAAGLLRVQAARGRAEAALRTLEESRAQALAQLLLERSGLGAAERVRLRGAVSDRDRALQAFSGAAVFRNQVRIALAEAREQRAPAAQRAAIRADLQAAGQQLLRARSASVQARLRADALLAAFRRKNPRLFAVQADPEADRRRLPSGALLAAFFVADEDTHLFLIAPDRPTRVFALPQGRRALTRKVVEWRAELTDPASDPTRRGRALFDGLFPPAAAKAIRNASRLVIAPDGPLWLAPFAALPWENGPSPRYLGEARSIVLAPSLHLFVRRTPARSAPTRAHALVVGDPLVDPVRGAAALPASGDEARQVAALYGAVPLLGAAATEPAVRAQLGQADVIHLAAHGVLDSAVPMASALLLSGEARGPEESSRDGRLEAWEIMQTPLRARIVVLSACETARGRSVAGEGVLGLTRALQYAGAQSVVASLWRVEDAATAALMTGLHRGLCGGLAAGDALRRAATSLRRDPRRAHPFYWAAFVLTEGPG